MKHSTTISISVFLIVCIIIAAALLYTKISIGKQQDVISAAALDHKETISLLSTQPDQIDVLVSKALAKIAAAIEMMTSDKKKTLENTILFFDQLQGLSDAAILANILEAMSLLHPDQKTREVALAGKLRISNYFIEHVSHNEAIYQSIVGCYQTLKTARSLDQTRHYCIERIIESFERDGIQLPNEKRQELSALFKDIQKHAATFEQNINTLVSPIEVHKEELDGLSDSFISALTKTPSDSYILTLDYPVYFTVMENCTNSQTRKKLYRAFNNRGYPDNETELSLLIAQRSKIAHLLGFETFASYDIANQMAKKCNTVQLFLDDLLNRLSTKLTQEYELLKNEAAILDIALAEETVFYPWDSTFLINSYKKRNFNLDEILISEYFPLQYTVDALLKLYESFFGITFEKIDSGVNLYDQDVITMRVSQKEDGKTLGHILFDLHPRPNKFSHAAHMTLVPSVRIDGTRDTEYVSIVIANFPRETKTQPALLKRADVKTFFHELGHALHALFGKTEFSAFSGTNTKWDFVEMPSQMLEEWLYDRTVLKQISNHYKTGQSLPDEIIDQIIKSKNVFSAFETRTQIFYALLSLTYYNTNGPVQLFEISKALRAKLMPEFFFDPENHFYASFGHLGGYGAKYYGYLYSSVFATDIFFTIKEHGLSNAEIGRKYRDTILANGGSVDPEVSMVSFLGRKPSIQPFVDNLFS